MPQRWVIGVCSRNIPGGLSQEPQNAQMWVIGVCRRNMPGCLSQKPQKGDGLTQIDWIYKIFLRKSAISARDCLTFHVMRGQAVGAYGNMPGGLSHNLQMQIRPHRSFSEIYSTSSMPNNRGNPRFRRLRCGLPAFKQGQAPSVGYARGVVRR